MSSTKPVVSRELLGIIEQLPTHPRSGDLLGALVRAERVGFERGLAMAAQLDAHREKAVQLVENALLRRQAAD